MPSPQTCNLEPAPETWHLYNPDTYAWERRPRDLDFDIGTGTMTPSP